MKSINFLIAITLAALSFTAQATDQTEQWTFQIIPYLWLPTIDGTLNYEVPNGAMSGSDSVSVGPTDWLELLNAAALVSASARKGRFSVFTDVVYLSMTKDSDGKLLEQDGSFGNNAFDASLKVTTSTDLDGLAWTLATAYTVKQTDELLVDVFIGARLFDIEVSTQLAVNTTLTTPSGETTSRSKYQAKGDTKLWDGIIGVKGHYRFVDKRWSVPYYIDAGTGSSDLTWNVMMGVSRNYHWGDLMLLYRHLEYDEGSSGLLQSFSFSGPAFGASFSF